MIGLDTDLYYLSLASDTLHTSEIHRIHYQPGINQAPSPQIKATPSGGPLNTLLQGSSGQFSIPTSGEIDPMVWYWVTLHLTDSVG